MSVPNSFTLQDGKVYYFAKINNNYKYSFIGLPLNVNPYLGGFFYKGNKLFKQNTLQISNINQSSLPDKNPLNFLIDTSKMTAVEYTNQSIGPNQQVVNTFYLTINGLIIISDGKNMYSINLDENNKMILSKNVNYQIFNYMPEMFQITSLYMPQELLTSNDSTLQTIWNKNIQAGKVEGDLVYDGVNPNTEIPKGFSCRLGIYANRPCDLGNDFTGTCTTDDNSFTESFADGSNRCYYKSDLKARNTYCIPGTYQVDYYHGGSHWDKVWCQYYDYNIGNQNACAEGIGNLQSLPTDSQGNIDKSKLSFSKCLLLYDNVTGTHGGDNINSPASLGAQYLASDKGINVSQTPAAWSPWSHETMNSDNQVYYDFCSQLDTRTNGPYYASNDNCQKWKNFNSSTDKDRKVQDMFCTANPSNSSCANFCIPSNSPGSDTGYTTPLCYDSMLNFCQGDNMNNQTCISWLSQNSVFQDDYIYKYCNDMINKGYDISDQKLSQICGCFMTDDYYNNYFSSLNKYMNIPNYLPYRPECYFAPCSAGSIKTKTQKQTPVSCPNITDCIQVDSVNINGIIDGGNINIFEDNSCNITRKCNPESAACDETAPCCDGLKCVKGSCQKPVIPCSKQNESCDISNYCCSGLNCVKGYCQIPCSQQNESCDPNNLCCSGLICVNGSCQIPSSPCKNKDESCDPNNLCCSGLDCSDGTCRTSKSCGKEKDDCKLDSDCCEGLMCIDSNKCGKKSSGGSNIGKIILFVCLAIILLLGLLFFLKKINK